jgi:hypothetical protein
MVTKEIGRCWICCDIDASGIVPPPIGQAVLSATQCMTTHVPAAPLRM